MATLRRKSLFVGIATAGVLIVVLITRLDWREFQQAIGGLQWVVVIAAGIAMLASMTARAARWLAISGDTGSGFAAYWNATVVGYVGNALYPGRAGEVLRIAALHRTARVPPGGALASAFVDRLADVVMLAAATLYVVIFVIRESFGGAVLTSVLGVATACLAGFLAVLTLGVRIHPLVVRACAGLPGHWGERLPRWYWQAVTACHAFAAPRRLIAALALTAVAFSLDYGALWLILRAFDWDMPLVAAMTIGVFLAIGSLLPAAPGYVGIYQVACVLALKWFGVSESAALAYSIVAQGATLLVIFLAGAVVALRYGLRWGLAKIPGA